MVKAFPKLHEPTRYDPKVARAYGAEFQIQWKKEPGQEEPYKAKPFRLSPDEKELVAKIIDKYKSRNWIRDSKSDWAAPTFLVPKKTIGADGKREMRFTVDYRRLNNQTRTQAFPLPKIDEIFDTLHGKFD